MRRATLIACAAIVLLLAAMAATTLLISVPPVRAHPAPGEFDAARAKARLARVLGDQRPHPADSLGDDMVRARLIAELQGMGLRPLVRDQLACNDFRKARLVSCTRVRNVIALLGPPAGKALLLSAHYDSVAAGPGASDDGVGVATLLEVASILKDGPLRRPVILLFNEGEELGLIGARAFLADPLSRNVDSLLNFDARGVTGPVTMFETSQPNGAAIGAFAGAVRRPFASSMMTDVARLIPNDTDVTAYKERGWLTLNFAMMGNETRYHSPGDDLAGLDPRSLQHMGDQALAVSSALASGVPLARGQRIFMDLAGRCLIQLPLLAGLVIAGLLILIFAILVRQRRAYGWALGSVAVAVVAAGGAGWLATLIMGALRAGTYWRAHPELSFMAIYATALLAALAVLTTMARRLRTEKLRAAFWLLFLVLGGALALAAPGAIIFFLIPPILVLLGVAVGRWYRPADGIGAAAALLFLYVSWGETLALSEELWSPGPLWIVAPVGSLILIAALVELQPLLRRSNRSAVLAFSVLAASLGWAAAAAAPAYSRDHEQRFTIEHVTQFPSGRSFWSVINDGASLPAAYSKMADWRRGKLSFSDRERWFAPAPPIAGLLPPSIQPLEIVRNGDERMIRLRLKANGAERILLTAPADSHLRTAGAAGFVRPIADADSEGKFTISCTGRSCDGIELTIDEGSDKPIVFMVAGSRNGLPPSAAPLVGLRPDNARPQYVPDEIIAVARVKI